MIRVKTVWYHIVQSVFSELNIRKRYLVTVVFPPISAEKADIARCCAPRQKNANNTRSKILLQKKVGAIDNTEC